MTAPFQNSQQANANITISNWFFSSFISLRLVEFILKIRIVTIVGGTNPSRKKNPQNKIQTWNIHNFFFAAIVNE